MSAEMNIEELEKNTIKVNEQIADADKNIAEFQKKIDDIIAFEKDLSNMKIDDEKKRQIAGNMSAMKFELFKGIYAWQRYQIALSKLKKSYLNLLLINIKIELIDAGEDNSPEFKRMQKIINIL